MFSFLKKGRKPPKGEGGKDADIVFEVVNDKPEKERVADFTYKEEAPNPAVEAVKKIMGVEQKIQAARQSGASRERLAVLDVQLAQAKFEQARLNERSGKGREGEADRLLEAWQEAQDGLENFRGSEIENALQAAMSRADYLSADDAAQMRRHQ